MPRPEPRARKAFDELIAAAPGARVKPMFGNLGAFVNGQMFAGVFGDQVFVRLGEGDRSAALRLPGARLFEPMKGRPMREYVVLPPKVLADTRRTRAWVAKSLAYVESKPARKAGRGK